MFRQVSLDIILFLLLYGVGMTMAASACIYLLMRQGNAFAKDITPPLRLRRWTALFFFVIAMAHLWYLPVAVLDSSEDVMLCMLIGALLDCMLAIPLALIVMLCMLQDRRRPLWPVGVMVAPLVAGMIWNVATRSEALLPWLYGYFLLMAVGFTIYMVRAVRQYGRWLHDNYADLEHKEVWQSFLVLAVIMLTFVYYMVGDGGIAYEYIVQVSGLVLIGYLLWRVETLSSLTPDPSPKSEGGGGEAETLSDAAYEKIASLLQQHCVDSQLYLQHDLNISQLAQALGTNRTYLRLYFMRQETNYNAYINDLRIRHFVRLYNEAVADQRFFTVQELASQSGYRNYNTFALAFKQRMGKSVTEWKQENR
ncbi:MAG: AraC family transcriptional regulator [Bacteroidaceae bacterium]|nr:AraC family transcriptional regulator [Bacteroidaceae bacterium]